MSSHKQTTISINKTLYKYLVINSFQNLNDYNIRILKVFFNSAVFLFKAIKKWNYRLDQKRELSTMPDYLLLDIGVRRDEISGVINGKVEIGSIRNLSDERSKGSIYKENSDTSLAA